MKNKSSVLPTRELKEGMGAVFTNGDTPATNKNLTRPQVARMAMAGAFADWIDLETQTPGSVRDMLFSR